MSQNVEYALDRKSLAGIDPRDAAFGDGRCDDASIHEIRPP